MIARDYPQNPANKATTLWRKWRYQYALKVVCVTIARLCIWTSFQSEILDKDRGESIRTIEQIVLRFQYTWRTGLPVQAEGVTALAYSGATKRPSPLLTGTPGRPPQLLTDRGGPGKAGLREASFWAWLRLCQSALRLVPSRHSCYSFPLYRHWSDKTLTGLLLVSFTHFTLVPFWISLFPLTPL